MPIKFTKETSSRLFRYVKTVDIKFNREFRKHWLYMNALAPFNPRGWFRGSSPHRFVFVLFQTLQSFSLTLIFSETLLCYFCSNSLRQQDEVGERNMEANASDAIPQGEPQTQDQYWSIGNSGGAWGSIQIYRRHWGESLCTVHSHEFRNRFPVRCWR